MGWLNVSAQSLSVESFKLLETDLTANTNGTIEIDQNGEKAALIKIITTETGFTFESGIMGIVKQVPKVSEIWVYIPHGLQRLKIMHPQLGQVEYYFPIPIEIACTYELKLISGTVRTIVEQSQTGQYVVFKVEPYDAVVSIDDGDPYPVNIEGMLSKYLPSGRHTYRVTSNSYFPESGVIELKNEKVEKIIKLQSAKATLTVNTAIDAEIWINEEKKGVGKWTGDLGAGDYLLEARKESHRTSVQEITLAQLEKREVTLPDPTPIYGSMDIQSIPIDCNVYLDGMYVGKTPLVVDEILIGNHDVSIEKNDFRTVKLRVPVSEGKRSIYSDVVLLRGISSETGSLSDIRPVIQDEEASQYIVFKGAPRDAVITIDSKQYECQPDGTLTKLLSYGKHSYSVEAPDFLSETGNIEIGNERLLRELSLKSSKGKVKLECPMNEAEIYLNGSLVGTGSWSGDLSAATYQVEVRRERYTTRSLSFTLQQLENRTISLPAPEPIYGSISVNSKPAGAKVYIDGADFGTTPLQNKKILIGSHSIEYRKQGYNPVTTYVEIQKNKLSSFNQVLNDIFELTVTSEPSGAKLYVNKEYEGTTPYSSAYTSGYCRVQLSKEGYDTYRKRVHIKDNTPLSVRLRPELSIIQSSVYWGLSARGGELFEFEANIGLHKKKINCEFNLIYDYKKEPTTIYWIGNTASFDVSDSNNFLGFSKYHISKISPAVHLGYNMRISDNVLLTPRFGMKLYHIKDDITKQSDDYYDNNYWYPKWDYRQRSYVVSGRSELLFELYLPKDNTSFIIVPTYDCPLIMGQLAGAINANTNVVKDWCGGLSIKLGFVHYLRRQ